MKAVAKIEQPDTQAIIQVIERAAANPQVDIEKMERLLAMQERILERNAKAAYTAALAQMQPRLPVITERGEIKNNSGRVQSTYALWEDLNEAIRPILAEYGFALTFRTGFDGHHITVTGVLSHREGHSEETTMYLPADATGSKNAVQAVGSSTQYGKRYTACALLNITSRGVDDDGQASCGPELISEKQAADVNALIEEVGADKGAMRRYYKLKRVEDIPVKALPDIVAALRRKGQRK